VRYVRNVWYMALWAQELEAGKTFARTILNEPIVLFRKEDGSVAALTDRCPHRFAPLSMGKLLPGDRLACAYHGLEFGANGACVRNPHGNGHIPPTARVRAYPVVEKHTILWIWMGEAAPTPETIPDYSCFDNAEPVRVTKRDYIRMKASCELVANNLMDTSHTSYLHEGILGGGDTVVAEMKIEEDGNTVRVSRVSQDSAVPGMYRQLTPKAIERTTKWNVIRWDPPSCILINGGVGGEGGDPSQGYGYSGCHLLTPETDRTTHYHFAAVRWNLISDDVAENERIRDWLSQMRHYAFAEQDAPVIEAQQRAMDLSPEPLRPALLTIDAGPARARRVLDRLIEHVEGQP
jgi:vanillate O-demethylase monooxygenase subunit